MTADEDKLAPGRGCTLGMVLGLAAWALVLVPLLIAVRWVT